MVRALRQRQNPGSVDITLGLSVLEIISKLVLSTQGREH